MNVKRLGQYMTPDWAADALVERYFGNLTGEDRVIEPACGRGAFLRAIPAHVPAVGVEIDPDLAAEAVRRSGRQVIVGDFRMVDIPTPPTAIIGNPPFASAIIHAILERAWTLLPDEGRVGLIVPCFFLQTAAVVDALAERWHLRQDMLPRNLFHRISHPICFAQFTKGPLRGLIGFALYGELAAINRLHLRYRELLDQGIGSCWAAVVRAALEAQGGTATLDALYRDIEGHRPTRNRFWQAKVRQQVQRVAVRIGPSTWQLHENAIVQHMTAVA